MRSSPFLALLLAVSAAAAPAPTLASASLPSGHFTWTGGAAADFALPGDLRLFSSWHDSKFNLDYKRYQQYASPLGTYVDGAQVTIVSRAGKQLIVAGAYYPGVHSARSPGLTVSGALAFAASARGGLTSLPDLIRAYATRRTDLRLDPTTGRLFYLVATAAPANNGYQEVDAQSGELLAAWGGVDQISAGQGVGVKGDTKQLSNPAEFNTIGDLTDFVSGAYKLQSADGNFITYDANGTNSIPSQAMSDGGFNNDDKWNDTSQAAGVDAQFYAALTVQFYNQELGYDWLNDCTIDSAHGTTGWPSKVRSVVHYDPSPNGVPYDNAFWDEQNYYMVYGDGSTFDRPLSAGQDVVSHELSHAVTQCRENLVYRNESGALNESFSDIMATAAEFIMDEPNSSNCRLAAGQTSCPDWLIGEDLAKTASGAVIRSLADPELEGQPSHYEDRVEQTCSPTTGNDFCGVHTNSGIPNHAFYLMANGGRNARCSGPTDPQDDCNVVVPPTSIDHATKIFFAGFGMLATNASMCDARNATVAQAAVLYPGSATDIAAAILAWQAVGLGDNCDASTDFTISLSDPTVELAPGGTGNTQLDLVRGVDNTNDKIKFTMDTAGPATVVANPTSNPGGDSSGSQINVTADNNAADGVYPILVAATGDITTQYAAASFLIDTTGPNAVVSNAQFVSGSSVTTGGVIPLNVSWNASDAGTGIGSAELDHSPNGSGWSAIYGPGPVISPTQYGASAGPHEFQVIATDNAGNSATSAALIRTLAAFQENAPQVVYHGTWTTSTEATPWGTTKFSKKRRATATLTFTGTAVVWVAQRGPKRGVANVFVDGVKTQVDLKTTTLSERRVVFIASNLTAGQHTIVVKVKATSGRPRVDVDGFFVLG